MNDTPVAAAIDVAQLLMAVNRTPATIADVIATMNTIDAVLPSGDGLKWFNLLYLKVTEAVDASTQHPVWNDPAWLERLDVLFAGLYFSAIASWYTAPATTPRAWADLFNARYRTDLLRLQFALCGMNAHIDHDLPLAVISTCRGMNISPANQSPQHVDFQSVNGLLDTVEPAAVTLLATGIVGEVIEDLGETGSVMSAWSIRAARDVAWNNALILHDLESLPFEEPANIFRAQLDASTGILGDVLLGRG